MVRSLRYPLMVFGLAATAAGSSAPVPSSVPARPAAAKPQPAETFLVTGYCSCGQCCGWRRTWFGFGSPVYSRGPNKGKPKKVGVTAAGTRAHRGTVAADPKVFPFGTKLEIPGYGVGTVEDVGSAVKGKHIDVWFPSHQEARSWGTRRLKIRKVKSVK